MVFSGGCGFPPWLFIDSPRADGVLVEWALLAARVVAVVVVVVRLVGGWEEGRGCLACLDVVWGLGPMWTGLLVRMISLRLHQ